MGIRISAEDLCSLTPTTELNQRPRVRSEVICYVLAGISKEASNFVRLKYANDENNMRVVAHELANRVRKKAPKVLSDEALWKLALIAIRESISDHMCGTCNGKSWVSTGMKQIVCFTCKGTGKRSKKSKDIATTSTANILLKEICWEYFPHMRGNCTMPSGIGCERPCNGLY